MNIIADNFALAFMTLLVIGGCWLVWKDENDNLPKP
jgi:hypothetical protein